VTTPEIRVRLILEAVGDQDTLAEQCLDGLLATCPGNGPVVTQDTRAGLLEVTVAMSATDCLAAVSQAWGLLTAALAAAGIEHATVFKVVATEIWPWNLDEDEQ
jgi:hypothetical protein